MYLHRRHLGLCLVTLASLALASCLSLGSDDWDDSARAGWEWDARLGWHRPGHHSSTERPPVPAADPPPDSGFRVDTDISDPDLAQDPPAVDEVTPETADHASEPLILRPEVTAPAVTQRPPVKIEPAVSPAPGTAAGNADTAKAGADASKQLAAKERQVGALERKLQIAQLELEEQARSAEAKQRKLQLALELAQAQLTAFTSMDLPNRIEKSSLTLESSQNQFQDAADELKQLEMMYKDSELEDKTSEIVLNRGRRQLDLSRRRLELAQRNRDLLLNHELPLKQRELEQKHEDAARAIRDAQRAASLDETRKRIAVADLEDQLRWLMEDIAELRDKVAAAPAKGSL